MRFRNTHVLVVDYDEDRRSDLCQLFDQRQAEVHPAGGKAEALGILWQLATEGIVPRAILANWLMDDPQAREFFTMVGREVDHTCLDLLRNAIKIDEAIPDNHETIMVCYAQTEIMGEALLELEAEGLSDRVALACADDGLDELAKLLFRDERTKIMQLLAEEVESKSDTGVFTNQSDRMLVEAPVPASTPFDEADAEADAAAGAQRLGSSGIRKALRRLSR